MPHTPRSTWRQLSAPIPGESPVEAIVRIATALVRCVSPYNLLLDRAWLPGASAGDAYVLGWLVVLISICIMVSAISAGWISFAVLAIATARLLDLFASQIGIVLIDRKRDAHHFQSIERSVILALINIGQAAICFGLISYVLAGLFGHMFVFATDCHNTTANESCIGSVPPQSVFDYIYMSWGQLLTVGSKYSPATYGAMALHMAMVAGGLLLIALSLATFIGGLVVKGPDPSRGQPKQRLSELLAAIRIARTNEEVRELTSQASELVQRL